MTTLFLRILVCPTESFRNYSPAMNLQHIARQTMIRTLCYYTFIGLLHIRMSFFIFSFKQSTENNWKNVKPKENRKMQEKTVKGDTRSIILRCKMHFAAWNLLVLASFLPCRAYLLVLVGRHSYELGFWEGMAGDHPLRATHSHDMNPRLVLVQGVQHDLWAKGQSR